MPLKPSDNYVSYLRFDEQLTLSKGEQIAIGTSRMQAAFAKYLVESEREGQEKAAADARDRERTAAAMAKTRQEMERKQEERAEQDAARRRAAEAHGAWLRKLPVELRTESLAILRGREELENAWWLHLAFSYGIALVVFLALTLTPDSMRFGYSARSLYGFAALVALAATFVRRRRSALLSVAYYAAQWPLKLLAYPIFWVLGFIPISLLAMLINKGSTFPDVFRWFIAWFPLGHCFDVGTTTGAKESLRRRTEAHEAAMRGRGHGPRDIGGTARRCVLEEFMA